MRTRLAACIGAALAGLLLGGATTAPTDPVFGFWLVEGDKAIVRIAPCGDLACGRIVWLQDDADAAGVRKTGGAEPGAAARHDPLCGIELMSGFRQQGQGAWKDGTIVSPRDGNHYSAEMRVRADGTLGLRGYLFLPALGSTQVWTRAEDDRGGC